MLKFYRIRKRVLRFLALVVTLGGACNTVLAQSGLDLPEEMVPILDGQIQSAFEASPRILMRLAEAEASEADFDSTKSMRLPNLGGWAQFSKAQDDRDYFVESQTSDKLYYSLTLRQPLFHWGNIHRTIQSSKIRTAIDAGQTRLAYLSLAGDIRKSYMEVVMERRMLERARFAARMNDDALVEAREKRRQNMNSEADVFNAELAKQRTDIDLAEAEDRFWYNSRVLARLTGAPELTADATPTSFPVPDVAGDAPILASMMSRFLADEFPDNTTLQNLALNLEISENNLKNTRTSLRPRIDFIAGMTSDEQQFALQNDTLEFQSMYAGIGLTWTLFDGFATNARVRASLSRLRAAELRYEQEKEELVDSARLMGRHLERLAKTVTLTERELDSAQNNLDYITEQAARGDASKAQVDNAQLGLWDALGKALFHRYNYWNKVSEVLSLTETDPLLDRVPTHIK
ncbi:MAG: hypothetical protein SynsKO_20130 [Synoicihabitans sp.]